jgi:hypothetical protein
VSAGERDPTTSPSGDLIPTIRVCVCVYYCRTYYKAVRVGGGSGNLEPTQGGACATRTMRSHLLLHYLVLPFVVVYYCSN